jgi:hypothetical protein
LGNDKHPKPDRRDEIAVWEARSQRSIAVNANVEERTRQIAQQGITAPDAAHLASAEAGGAEIMLTCDDVVLRQAPRLGLALRPMAKQLTEQELRQQAVRALSDSLGPVDALRFLALVSREPFDDQQWRKEYFSHYSVDELLEKVRNHHSGQCEIAGSDQRKILIRQYKCAE